MADEVEVTEIVGPFTEGAWKSEPTVVANTEIEVKAEEVPAAEIIKAEEVEQTIVAEKQEVVETPKEISYKNEDSKKVANLLLEGNIEEVRKILNEQKTLADSENLSAEEKIKLSIQYKNRDFSPKEVEEYFNELYEAPKKPEQKSLESDEEFEEREEEYKAKLAKIESKISRDSKAALAELQKYKSEIVIPDTLREQPDNVPTQEELDAIKNRQEAFLKTVDLELGKFNGYETTFKDEEVEIKVAYRPSNEEKIELQPLLALAGTNAGEFLQKIGWLDKDGNINTAKLIEDLPFTLDKGKVIQKMTSETANKRREASIKSIKNIDYSGHTPSGNGDLGKTPQQIETDMVRHFFRQ